jgi:hypothetical protein
MSEMFSLMPWWISLPLLAGGCVLTLIVGFATFTALAFLAEQTWHGSVRLTESLAGLIVNLTMTAFDACVSLLKMLVILMLWPLTIVWEYTAVWAYNAVALKTEALRQRRELWHYWRREFRDQFPTFAEFMEAFEGGGQRREEPQFEEELRPDRRGQDERKPDKPPRPSPPSPPPRPSPPSPPPRPRPPPPPPPPDPQRAAFIAACRVFGLPESGEFTVNDLKTRYRTLISKAHPDRAGHNGAATSINVARDLIKQRKGWT